MYVEFSMCIVIYGWQCILFPNKREGGLHDHLICRNINIASCFKDWLLKSTSLSENASEKKTFNIWFTYNKWNEVEYEC